MENYLTLHIVCFKRKNNNRNNDNSMNKDRVIEFHFMYLSMSQSLTIDKMLLCELSKLSD